MSEYLLKKISLGFPDDSKTDLAGIGIDKVKLKARRSQNVEISGNELFNKVRNMKKFNISPKNYHYEQIVDLIPEIFLGKL